MNLRLVQFSFAERSAAQALADEIVPAIRSQPGCERCVFFADYDAGDYGIAVLWESQQAADAAAAVISPILMKGIEAGGTVQSRRLFEVYEP
jgi:quinol monooxygenase YgiN